MDLLTPLFDQDKLHQHFKTISDGRIGRHYQRDEIMRWLEGFPDRDKKFVNEFQTTFNSSFWEIYLYATFREYGFSFDWKHAAPDFLLTAADTTFTVEATTANHAADGTPEWGEPLTPDFYDNVDFNELNRIAIIRLANAFMSKSKKYLDKYANHGHVKGRPFVLAVAPFEQPGFHLQAYRPIEAMLFDHYVDEAEYMANPQRFPNGPLARSLGTVEKDNGAEIELGFFHNPRFSHISAVAFSHLATWGKVDAMCGNPDAIIRSIWLTPEGMRPVVVKANEGPEKITDGLRIYHNPYATNPLPLEVFRREGVVQIWADRDGHELLHEQADNCLQSRTAMTFLRGKPGDFDEKAVP
ncbi:hypothetical protein [Pseudomonas sp. BEA3.1]|uniref:hypothetical protein n=1 Tax=Pseudomonas sp. BEA3.1 TaxID=3083251 RepID=UPI002964507D|nr:hypothetical protein [Pseudomonas sp. BEA3.1]MDW2776323.1 hypothetical protein [Pseudomonas sp. BEA3.1]